MAHLLEKTRKITSILKRSDEQLQEELPYNAITRQLADIIDCNACIVNSKGRLLVFYALQNQYGSCRAVLPN